MHRPAGVTAVISEELKTVKLWAAVMPNATAVAPLKLLPVSVTLVPPSVVPLSGVMVETVGAGVK